MIVRAFLRSSSQHRAVPSTLEANVLRLPIEMLQSHYEHLSHRPLSIGWYLFTLEATIQRLPTEMRTSSRECLSKIDPVIMLMLPTD
jgi:hypothetical protein